MLLQEYGFIEHLNRRYYPLEEERKAGKHITKLEKLNLNDLSGIFYIYGVIILLATLVLIGEIIVARFFS